MASLPNGVVNGHSETPGSALGPQRFADIPPVIDIPVSGGEGEEAVEVSLEELLDDPTELCTLLENENVGKQYWMTVALAYAKQRKVDHAIEMVTKGLAALSAARSEEKLSLLCCLCWLYLLKSREAPRIKPDNQAASEIRLKDFYLQSATSTLNEASRISPSFPPLFLARGVLQLLRASLQAPAKIAHGSQDTSERAEMTRQALKCFEDALKASQNKNMMAWLGRARAHFSLRRYADALNGYQHVLERAPDLSDPDPRIGIGCCFWALGFKDDAKSAWQRALEVNPDNKIANILLGLFHLDISSQYPTTDPKFVEAYRTAMTDYTQKAFRLDKMLPLTCVTFGAFLLARKNMAQAEGLARRAIELTDVSAIASDGWYLLARKEHYSNEVSKASDCYEKADQARGGEDKGFLPAKFGLAQLQILKNDLDGAKFRLERIVQQSKSLEAMIVLGALYAEDVFQAQTAATKEDKTVEMRKAISLLENVRTAWKDPKRKASPDLSVLLILARLYEQESPDKSLQCLQQVEQIELEGIPDEDRPEDVGDQATMTALLREYLPPQLLNNMGCFHYQAERYAQARELFQTALNACVKVGDRDQGIDTDALVTTISFNLARTYEAEGMLDEAKKVYEGLLERHNDYTDANARLTYIALKQSPSDDGPKAMEEFLEAEPANLEVRCLYGWYQLRSKKKWTSLAEDPEQRHHKHTLQQYDKHDRYALVGMGNLHLSYAREMRRDTDQEKDKRRKMYEKAVEFFDKALQLDPKNAYAAQGIGIAMVEDKRDFPTALQIFTKVRETVRDAAVFINLGHVYCELKQYSRAIENYEAALAKERGRDQQLLACLGRVWLLRGKQEKSIQAMRTALDYSRRALEASPDQPHFKFNVAFVQIQIAQLIYTLPEMQRTLEEVESAAAGLDEAIESFSAIARGPNPPFPKHDIEQRANMGRNTMRKQLERAVQQQKEYEQKNAARLQQARELREAEMRQREEAKRKAEEEANERRRQIAEDRAKRQGQDRLLAEARAAEDEEKRRKEEADMSMDEETGEKKRRPKRKGGKRKKKGEEVVTDGEVDGTEGEGRGSRQKSVATSNTPATSGDERPRRRKKRKLERKGKAESKYKSSELVEDSSEEEAAKDANGDKQPDSTPQQTSDQIMQDGEDDEEDAVVRPRKKTARIVDEDDDEGLDGEEDALATSPATNGIDTHEGKDVSMVDTTVAAAGNEDGGGLNGESYEGFS